MKSARKWALTLGVVALVGAACNGATPTNTATPATGEGVTAAGQVAGTGSLPAPLQMIEGTAEDIIDVVPNDDWHQDAADVNDLTAAWRTYTARAKTDGASDALVSRFDGALNALEIAADGHQAEETMQASNDLSAATIELYGLYDPAVPDRYRTPGCVGSPDSPGRGATGLGCNRDHDDRAQLDLGKGQIQHRGARRDRRCHAVRRQHPITRQGSLGEQL